MGLTLSQLRKASWREVKRLATTKGEFVVHVADGIEGITLTHDVRHGDNGKSKTIIGYTVRASGRTFDSPSAAIKHFNACEQGRQGERHAPGSPQSIAERRRPPSGA